MSKESDFATKEPASFKSNILKHPNEVNVEKIRVLLFVNLIISLIPDIIGFSASLADRARGQAIPE